MSSESESAAVTRMFYKGEWRFTGKTESGFDELLLNIGKRNVTLIQKENQSVVRKKSFPRDVYATGRFLFFPLSAAEGEDLFYVKNGTEETMICGECRDGDLSDPVWEIEVIRQKEI
jgi:hypothetical protein